MEASVIYHDGEEVEVGWFGLILYRLRGFWRTCKQTDWKNYFQGNGPGEVTWKEFTGFRENPNDLGCSAQWCICVKGGIRMRDGNYYYRNITVSDLERCVDKDWSDKVKGKVAEQERILDLYAEPDCSCRLGFHCRCPYHKTTKH